jgi:hypothetical protein
MLMLTTTLSSLCHTDIVHILWLHGVVSLLFSLLSRFSHQHNIVKRRDRLTMVYFDNLDNGFLNKYKKNLKNEKKCIDVILYI